MDNRRVALLIHPIIILVLQARHPNRNYVRLSVRHWLLSTAETVCLGCLTIISRGNLRSYDALNTSSHFRRASAIIISQICASVCPSVGLTVRPAVNNGLPTTSAWHRRHNFDDFDALTTRRISDVHLRSSYRRSMRMSVRPSV